MSTTDPNREPSRPPAGTCPLPRPRPRSRPCRHPDPRRHAEAATPGIPAGRLTASPWPRYAGLRLRG